jgi:hypothetical protein
MITVNDILTDFRTFKTRVEEYYALINGQVDADANLSGLTSTSKTAEYNLWMWVFAAMSVIMDGLWEERKSEIQAIADSAIPGTERWLQKEILKFQYGDTLNFDDDTAKYSYDEIDTDAQIVKRCAIQSTGSVSSVKVAKESAGSPVPLLMDELTALRSYVNQIKWAGMQLTVNSLNSDKINAPLTIYYNGIVPVADMKVLVQEAFTNYLANLPFNGQFTITKLIDAIQLVPNVNDVVAGAIQAKPNSGTYSPVARIYIPISGYIEKDGAISFDTMFTYIAE